MKNLTQFNKNFQWNRMQLFWEIGDLKKTIEDFEELKTKVTAVLKQKNKEFQYYKQSILD
jgi:hypothetical protein